MLRLKDSAVFGLEEAARAVVDIHHALADWLRVGMNTTQIDQEVARLLKSMQANSCFLHYRRPGLPPFPSHSCLSLNDCIVHGTAWTHEEPLKEGDVLKIDIGVRKNRWIGDAAWTYSFGVPIPEVRKLMNCGKEALVRGIQALQPGAPLNNWAEVVQGYVEGECGLCVVEGLGGHGYRKKLHEDPWVSNVVPRNGLRWREASWPVQVGWALAVEPMIATGTSQTRDVKGEWPMYTADGSMAVHYEADVLITEDGPRDLTSGLSDVNDVIDR